MNCPNCGAAMELFEQRRYYYCTHCGSFQFIEHDAGEGVHAVDRAGADSCPLCAAPLAASVTNEGYSVQQCERCHGLFMDRRTFAELVTRRRASAGGPGTPPQQIDPRELRRDVTCPRCRQKMDVHPYFGPGNVVIDTCARCDTVWLDSGELTQIVDAPGRDRRGN
jgi:Zn-finger nucleic acid-binding protein